MADTVTPLAGVWIEIFRFDIKTMCFIVTPLAGVWIEITAILTQHPRGTSSLPLRECGLKFM